MPEVILIEMACPNCGGAILERAVQVHGRARVVCPNCGLRLALEDGRPTDAAREIMKQALRQAARRRNR